MPDVCQYALDLLARLYGAYSVEHHPTALTDARGSHTRFPDGRPQIVLGRPSLRRVFEHGFEEYPSLAALIGYRRPAGLAGVHQLCLHEFAHVLQFHDGCLNVRAVHNACFIKRYVELIRSYPLNSDGPDAS